MGPNKNLKLSLSKQDKYTNKIKTTVHSFLKNHSNPQIAVIFDSP